MFPYPGDGTGYVRVASWYFTWRHNNTASDSGQALKNLCGLEVL